MIALLNKRKGQGFTLIEILLVLAIIAVLLFMSLPQLSKHKHDSELTAAKTKASALNVAKSSYLSAAGATAETEWQTLDDTARYQRIRPYLGMAPAALSDYLPDGYTIDLGTSLYTPVILAEDGTVVPYN